jgi:hypothetical protein
MVDSLRLAYGGDPGYRVQSGIAAFEGGAQGHRPARPDRQMGQDGRPRLESSAAPSPIWGSATVSPLFQTPARRRSPGRGDVDIVARRASPRGAGILSSPR